MASRFAMVAASSSLFLACPELAEGHAFLIEPPSRNSLAQKAGKQNCPHCMQSGGPSRVKARGSGVWPTVLDPDSHGLCGDPVQQATEDPADLASSPYLVPTEVQRTYKAGEIVEFRIGMNAHHKGHYEFRICDKSLDGSRLSSAKDGQDCLNKWVLERAPVDASCGSGGGNTRADCQPIDEKHPGRWYLPPPNKGTAVAGAGFDDNDAPYATNEYHVMKYKIPDDLSCEHCTLQWYWSTGNTCLYDVDYAGPDGYFERNAAAFEAFGWKTEEWCPFCRLDWIVSSDGSCNWCCATGGSFGEEFWNCADIAVTGSGSGPGPAPAPSPPVTTTEASTTSVETTTAATATTTTKMPTTTVAVVTTSPSTCGGGAGPKTVCLAKRDSMAPNMGGWTDAKCNEECMNVAAADWKFPCTDQGPCGCVALAAPATTASPTTVAPTTTTTTAAAGGCAAAWEQCGGQTWSGPTCCASGWKCNYGNPWYSQCVKA